MSKPNEEERFQTNIKGVTDFVHGLISECWEKKGIKDINPILIQLAGTYLSSLDKKILIETFIENSYKYWKEIKEHNENFFVENCSKVFSKLPVGQGNIDAFKILFTKKDGDGNYIIDNEDRITIWEYFESFVKISIKYVHRIRDCYLEQDAEGKYKPRYRYNKFPEIKVRELSKIWAIELEMPSA